MSLVVYFFCLKIFVCNHNKDKLSTGPNTNLIQFNEMTGWNGENLTVLCLAYPFSSTDAILPAYEPRNKRTLNYSDETTDHQETSAEPTACGRHRALRTAVASRLVDEIVGLSGISDASRSTLDWKESRENNKNREVHRD